MLSEPIHSWISVSLSVHFSTQILIFDIPNALGAATTSVLHFTILLGQKIGLFMEFVI